MNSGELNNITDYLFDFAKANLGKPALLHPKKITFSELCALIEKYATGLVKSGIAKGTKTIVLIHPGIDLFAVTFALLRTGAIPVLIDPGMGMKAMTKALSKTGAEAFIGVSKAHWLRFLFPKSFQSVHINIVLGFRWFPGGINMHSFQKIKNYNFEVSKGLPNDNVAVFFTSGSTGPAKGVIYQHRTLEAQIQYLKNHFKYNPEGIDLCTFPLIGMLVINLGLSVVLADMDMAHPATLNPRKLIENIKQFNCTHMFCSPMVLRKLANYGNENSINLTSIKKIFTAGAPVTPYLLQDFRKILTENAEIHTPFGSTEALSITDIADLEIAKIYSESNNYYEGFCVGFPLPGIDLKIIKISDNPIESWENVEEFQSGEVGEIVVKGPNVTQQYLANDLANSFSKIKDRNSDLLWHRTGDLGKLDEHGKVWFYGRKSQRVETKYKTLFTIPCEAVFNRHPKVLRSALTSVKLEGNIVPLICIELESGVKKSGQIIKELLNFAKENEWTNTISLILFHKKFPVDPRHNAKIFREKLAVWAQNQLR